MFKDMNQMAHDTDALELFFEERFGHTFVEFKLSCDHSTIKQ